MSRKRIERLQQLMKEGKLTEDDSVYGLPKVRTSFKVKKKKVAEDEQTSEGEGEGEETPAAE